MFCYFLYKFRPKHYSFCEEMRDVTKNEFWSSSKVPGYSFRILMKI